MYSEVCACDLLIVNDDSSRSDFARSLTFSTGARALAHLLHQWHFRRICCGAGHLVAIYSRTSSPAKGLKSFDKFPVHQVVVCDEVLCSHTRASKEGYVTAAYYSADQDETQNAPRRSARQYEYVSCRFYARSLTGAIRFAW